VWITSGIGPQITHVIFMKNLSILKSNSLVCITVNSERYADIKMMLQNAMGGFHLRLQQCKTLISTHKTLK
ncbi:hypothetical protein L9F63_003548, partial [Diploptera punctata]